LKYLYPKQVIFIHNQIIELTGGLPGIRDEGLLKSAVARPRATFAGNELYPTLFEKVAALGISLAKNHPFLDGNKRTALETIRIMLKLNNRNLNLNVGKKVQLIMNIVNDVWDLEKTSEYLQANCSKLTRKRKI